VSRARITADADYPNRCTIRYEDEYGYPLHREYYAPTQGGYVQRVGWGQVCEKLQGGGATLTWNPSHDKTLADLIRRERRAAMRADRQRWED